MRRETSGVEFICEGTCLFLNVCDFYLQNGNEHHLRQKVVCYKREVLVVNDLNTFTLRVYNIPPYQNFFCIIRILSSINNSP